MALVLEQNFLKRRRMARSIIAHSSSPATRDLEIKKKSLKFYLIPIRIAETKI